MTFSEKLKQAMQELHLNQRQICGLTGKSKGSVSQYLSGKQVPSVEVQSSIATALGLEADYFEKLDDQITILPSSEVRNGIIPKLLPEVAAKYECVDNSVTFVQYQAGAMGGNYQKANKIVYFTLPLGKGSCDLWEQSKKRIHRIGQNRPCYYYYLLVKGSFEERNLAALREGKELTDDLFEK